MRLFRPRLSSKERNRQSLRRQIRRLRDGRAFEQGEVKVVKHVRDTSAGRQTRFHLYLSYSAQREQDDPDFIATGRTSYGRPSLYAPNLTLDQVMNKLESRLPRW